MELLKHELYKIFTRKSIYFALGILLIFYSLPLLESGINANREWREMAQVYQEWEGPVTKEKVEFALEARDQEFVEIEPNLYGAPDRNIHTLAADILNMEQRLINWKERLAGLDTEISELGKENSGGFEYKEKVMAYEALEKVGPPEIYYNRGWQDIVDFVNTYGLLFMGALVLLGLSPVFSEEYSNGTDNFILTSKKGKSSIIMSKIMASFIYIMGLVIFFAILNILVNWYRFSLIGWDVPLRNLYQYSYTPYAFDLWQYYLIQLAIHTLGAMAFGLVVLVISAVSKSALIPFFVGGVIFSVPILLTSIFRVEIPWVLRVVEFSHTEFMKVTVFFTQFKAFNIFGYPVLYLNFTSIVFSVISLMIFYLIYYKFRHHQVT